MCSVCANGDLMLLLLLRFAAFATQGIMDTYWYDCDEEQLTTRYSHVSTVTLPWCSHKGLTECHHACMRTRLQ